MDAHLDEHGIDFVGCLTSDEIKGITDEDMLQAVFRALSANPRIIVVNAYFRSHLKYGGKMLTKKQFEKVRHHFRGRNESGADDVTHWLEDRIIDIL